MATLDLARLEAEAIAWPYVSDLAYQRGMSSLRRTRVGVLEADTDDLARELQAHLRLRASGASLETLRLVRDTCWFHEDAGRRVVRARDDATVPLHAHLRAVARARLRLDGTCVRLAETVGARLHETALAWRWLSLALPQDLLVAALSAHEGVAPTNQVTLAPPILDRMLRERDVAQVHEHLGAATSFEVVWTHLMTRLAVSDLPPEKLEAEGCAAPFGSWQGFSNLLSAAALARLTMAGFLWRTQREGGQRFERFVREVVDDSTLGRVHARALAAMYLGGEAPRASLTRRAYRRYRGEGFRWPPRCLEELLDNDPVSRWLGTSRECCAETRFLAASLRRMEQDSDPHFERLFWQYVRVRARTHRHLCHEPGTVGLDWFSAHYRRMEPFATGLDAVEAEVAIGLHARGTKLRSLELRKGPRARWPEVRDRVWHVAKAPAREPLERALVLHFVKEREPADARRLRADARRLHADPRRLAFPARYGAYFMEKQREALAIEGAFTRMPELLRVLRGLDVCNLELAVPHWVFFPLFTRLRRSASRVAARLAGSDHVPGLRLTLHVGEEYRHLAEGLRRVHEPIEYGVLERGDRLGHALALGCDVGRWADDNPRVMMPAEERLDDLLWELKLVRERRIRADGARVEVLRASIEALAQSIYGRSDDVAVLLRARDARHDPATLERLGYPRVDPARTGAEPFERCLLAHLMDGEVFVRGQAPCAVEIDAQERAALTLAQRFVQEEVARLGLTVESNPSSNLLIGDHGLEEHPAFALQPLRATAQGAGVRVPVALGDDDPITFASSLADEYAYIFHGLVQRGYDAETATRWLDTARENGWLARFSLESSATKGESRVGCRAREDVGRGSLSPRGRVSP